MKKNHYSTDTFESIFKKASKTYFYSSVFFPEAIKKKVFRLYVFVRRADDYVDNIPQQKDEFEAFYNSWKNLKLGKESKLLPTNKTEDLDIIKSFIELEKECNFDIQWTESFFDSMRADTKKNTYLNYDELEKYIYGSADVIGLYMCQIMNVTPIYWESAKKLGSAFQLINFIRDINEDNSLGRQYLPISEMKKYGLDKLEKQYILLNDKEKEFKYFIQAQIEKYREWQEIADQGIRALPRRVQGAIKTASKLYSWTANVIEKNPMIVFEKKVKPRKRRVIGTYVMQLFDR